MLYASASSYIHLKKKVRAFWLCNKKKKRFFLLSMKRGASWKFSKGSFPYRQTTRSAKKTIKMYTGRISTDQFVATNGFFLFGGLRVISPPPRRRKKCIVGISSLLLWNSSSCVVKCKWVVCVIRWPAFGIATVECVVSQCRRKTWWCQRELLVFF